LTYIAKTMVPHVLQFFMIVTSKRKELEKNPYFTCPARASPHSVATGFKK